MNPIAYPDGGPGAAPFQAARRRRRVAGMKETTITGLLVAEAVRYLVAVDAFRAAGCEPRWEAERVEVAMAATV